MKPTPSASRRILTTSVAVVLAQAAGLGATWNFDASGLWNDPLNWTGGVPNGVDAIADASTIDITANQTITLDGSFTVGTLQFGDATTASHDWSLTPLNPADTLTLDVSGGVPVLNVTSRNVTIGTILAGNEGLSKTGAGSAFLTAANTYTGNTTITAGALILSGSGSLASTSVVNSAGVGGGGAPGGFEIRRLDFYAVPFTITNPGNNNGAGSLTVNSGVFANASTGASINGVVRQGTLAVGRGENFGRLFLEEGADIGVGNFYLGEQNGRTGQVIQNGGTVTVANQMRVGHWPQGHPETDAANTTVPSSYTLNSGTVTITSAVAGTPFGAAGSSERNGVLYIGIDSTGEVIVNGGTLDVRSIVLDNRAATNGIDRLTINGGTVRVGGVAPGNDVDPANSGSAIASANASTTYEVNYTGGTIQTTGSVLHNVAAIFSDTNGGITFDTAAQAHVITATGALSGGGGFTKTGPGTLLLKGTNTYTGTTTINDGVLTVTTALPTTNDVAISGTGVLNSAGDGLTTGLVGNVVATGGGTIQPGADAADGTIGTITLASLDFAGNARLDLNPTDFTTGGVVNDFIQVSGATTLNGGTITPVWSTTPNSGTYTILSSAGGITLAQLPSVNLPPSRQTYTVGVAGNDVQLTVAGSGPLAINWSGGLNANTWDVATTMNWRLTVPNDEQFFNFDDVHFDDLGVGGNVIIAEPVQTGTTTVNAAQDYAFVGPGGIAAGDLVKSGAGMLLLETENTYGGTTTIMEGKVQVGSGGTAGMLGGTGEIVNNGTLAFNRSDTVTLDRLVSGGGGIVQDGAGTLALTVANSYTGGTSVNAGVLRVGNSSALGAHGSLVTVAPGATLDIAGTPSGANRYDLIIGGTGVAGQAAVWNSGASVVNNPVFRSITLTADTTIGTNSRTDLNGGVGGVTVNGGTFSLIKVGTGETWWAPNAGATIGDIFVQQGTFGVQNSNNLGSGAHSIIVNSGGQLITFSAVTNSKPVVINGGLLGANNNTGTWTGPVTLSGPGTSNRIGTINTGVGVTLAGPLTGTGGFEKVNAGVVTLQNPGNDWQGDTLISAGTLQLSGAGILSPSTTIDMNGGALNLGGTAQTVAGLRGVAGSILGDGTLTVNQAGNTEYFGTIDSATSLVKGGAGTLTLSGSSATTGATTVNLGALIVTGSMSGSAVTVNPDGLLGGTGVVGAVNVIGGVVAPGASPGTLSTAAFTLDPDAVLQFELAQPGVVGGGVNDLVSVTGGLTLDGTLQVLTLAGFDEGTYRLFDYTGSLTDNGLALDPAFLGLYPGSFVDTGTVNEVNLVVVPEPATLATLLGGLGALLGFGRRRSPRLS